MDVNQILELAYEQQAAGREMSSMDTLCAALDTFLLEEPDKASELINQVDLDRISIASALLLLSLIRIVPEIKEREIIGFKRIQNHIKHRRPDDYQQILAGLD